MANRPYLPAPELQRVLDDLNRIGNPLDQLTSESVFTLWMQREVLSAGVLSPIPMANVHDLCVPARNRQIPIRIYVPIDRSLESEGGLPVLIYYHGGGWTLGSLSTYDSLCRALSHAGTMVVSVDYRLAPEHPFPAAVVDAHLAFEWVARNIANYGGSVRRLGVAGDSAGGTLATVVARRARKEGVPLTLQALLYPATNVTDTASASFREYGEQHWLTTRAVEAFRSFYLPDARDWHHPDASPLLAADEELRFLPPTLIMTAGCDPLRDQGQAYAERLRNLGVSVEYHLERDMIHACFNLFNSAFYPDASRRVEPVVYDLARAIRRFWTISPT
jgi:acetyl esterase